MAPVGVVVLVATWVGLSLGFGLWMLGWPKHYWSTWKSCLQRRDRPDGLLAARDRALERYVNRPHPDRRARILGAVFLLAGLLVASLLLFGFLPVQ
jgi:hypothetical protein